MSMLKGYTMIIDDHCECRKVFTPFQLIDQRNATQHALLSLVPRAGSSECCRIAMLIYSLIVTFPLSFNVSPIQQLVKLLHTALGTWNGDDQNLLWILAMGGIGAIESGDRMWFVKIFRGLTIKMGITSWSEAKNVLRQSLWHDATNEQDGLDLWQESRDSHKLEGRVHQTAPLFE